VAAIYDQPVLRWLLPVAGIEALIMSLRSTNFITAQRHLMLGRRTMLELGGQALGILCMIALAWLTRSVWALLLGPLIGTVALTLSTHLVLPGIRNRLRFERAACREVIHFGKWIFLATLATYLCGQGLRLVQGALVDAATLGMISIAAMLAWSVGELVTKLSHEVLLPAYAQIHQHRPDELPHRTFQARRRLAAITVPAYSALILLGPLIVTVLYDPRWQQAGLYLSILAAGGGIIAVTQSYGSALLACGDSKRYTLIQVISAAARIVALVVGYQLGGAVGMLLGAAGASVLIYPLQAWCAHRYRMWQPLLDSAVLVALPAALVLTLTLLV
jgi:O-antigen/teichoic acid export membrane protein